MTYLCLVVSGCIRLILYRAFFLCVWFSCCELPFFCQTTFMILCFPLKSLTVLIFFSRFHITQHVYSYSYTYILMMWYCWHDNVRPQLFPSGGNSFQIDLSSTEKSSRSPCFLFFSPSFNNYLILLPNAVSGAEQNPRQYSIRTHLQHVHFTSRLTGRHVLERF